MTVHTSYTQRRIQHGEKLTFPEAIKAPIQNTADTNTRMLCMPRRTVERKTKQESHQSEERQTDRGKEDPKENGGGLAENEDGKHRERETEDTC